MTNELQVLDHGYVKLLNLSGPTRRSINTFDADDVDPANVARKSFDQTGTKASEEDLKLNDYLLRQSPPHSEPFEFIETWWEMKLPLFVAAQMKRHRTARLWEPTEAVLDPSIDEMSLRYVKAYPEWYTPEENRITIRPANIKQGSGTEQYPKAAQFCNDLDNHLGTGYELYSHYVDQGVAPELCRGFLSPFNYTGWVWKQDLWNIFHFLACRDHSHAQWEAQQYAKAMSAILKKYLPNLMELYEKYRRKQ